MRKPSPPDFAIEVILPAIALALAAYMVHTDQPRWLPLVTLVGFAGIALALGTFALHCMNYRRELAKYKDYLRHLEQYRLFKRSKLPPRRRNAG